MPAQVIRASSAQGLTLLESSVAVANDGFVTITARFLAPASGYNASTFALDSPWPIANLPTGVPALQGGPYLISHEVKRENLLTIINATYVSALNPPRVSVDEATEQRSFSGSSVRFDSVFGLLFQDISFDYYTTSQTVNYAVIAPNTVSIAPAGLIGQKFNVRSVGNPDLIQFKEREFVTTSRSRVGKVARISSTATKILEQADSGVGGAPIETIAAASPFFNLWTRLGF